MSGMFGEWVISYAADGNRTSNPVGAATAAANNKKKEEKKKKGFGRF